MDESDVNFRPGFNLEAAFRGHLSPVRRVAYNARNKQFLSMDEHCVKSWSKDHDGGTTVHHDVQFPNYQSNFITSFVFSQELGLLFASCLDDNLRLYNERLRLKSCMPWSNGVVREVGFGVPGAGHHLRHTLWHRHCAADVTPSTHQRKRCYRRTATLPLTAASRGVKERDGSSGSCHRSSGSPQPSCMCAHSAHTHHCPTRHRQITRSAFDAQTATYLAAAVRALYSCPCCETMAHPLPTQMLFYEPRALLITAGSYGVKVIAELSPVILKGMFLRA